MNFVKQCILIAHLYFFKITKEGNAIKKHLH
jgi:hypothetical protein